MRQADCATTGDALLAWWLGELDAVDDERLDEHLFGCSVCTSRLASLIGLGDSIRRATLRGTFGFVVPAAFVDRMKSTGPTVREYTLASGGSVNCTIAPGDDFVVSHLHAPLTGVRRLDVLIDDAALGSVRLPDVPFDPKADTLVVVPSAAFLRSLGAARQTLRLVAVDGADERELADYTFNHAPWP
jgi:hypothetical protein